MQITKNIGRKIMIPYTFNTSIKKKRKVFWKYEFEIEQKNNISFDLYLFEAYYVGIKKNIVNNECYCFLLLFRSS